MNERKFLVSYGETDLDNVLIECKSEEIGLVGCWGLSDGETAKRIIQYIESRITINGNIVLYNFWEIDE